MAGNPSGTPVYPFPQPPSHAFVEITNICSGGCRFCPSGISKRSPLHLKPEWFYKFINGLKACGFTPSTHFHVLGEPLQNPRFFQHLKTAARSGIPVTVVSSKALSGPDRLNKLLAHEPGCLVVSFDPQMDDDRYISLYSRAMEAKYARPSRSRIEFHLGSDTLWRQSGLLHLDDGAALPHILPRYDVNQRFRTLAEKLDQESRKLSRLYPEEYGRQYKTTLKECSPEIKRGMISLDIKDIPGDVDSLSEEAYWGHMAAPGVFLRVKQFGLWNQKPGFLRKILPEDTFFFIEERTSPVRCSLAEGLVMLSDGTLTGCCLDYDGDLAMGHIEELDVPSFWQLKERRRLAENAMQFKPCRRCKGKLFLFSRTPPPGPEQELKALGTGWHEYEPELLNQGGRWSTGDSNLYFFNRLPAAREVRLQLVVPQADDKIDISISRYNPDQDTFTSPEVHTKTPSNPGQVEEIHLRQPFDQFALYRIRIQSPARRLSPDDPRNLGIILLSAHARG
jgi:hypothetical protein